MGTALTWTQFLILLCLQHLTLTWCSIKGGRRAGRKGGNKEKKKGENNRKKRESKGKDGPKIHLLKLDDYSN